MAAATLILKPGKEKSLHRHHPWIFSGAIAKVSGPVEMGTTVVVRAADGRFLAHAAYSPVSQIRARVWSFREDDVIDESFFAERITQAFTRRSRMRIDSSAQRLIHGEADGLPGLIVDRYGDLLVAQFLCAGVEHHRAQIVSALSGLAGVLGVYERSDADIRELEGLAPRCGLLAGQMPSGPIAIVENGIAFDVDIEHGHKTGFYLDQRENRAWLREHARGDVLNCFCYTGGFSIAAALGGAATVLSIDSSADALALAGRNVALNGLEGAVMEWHSADVFKALRTLRDQGRQFDTIILDPPKFAPTAGHVERAARAYKDINLLAFKLLRHDGLLLSFSCSGGVSGELFQKIVAGAASDAGVGVLIERRVAAGADHPVRLSFPEGEYLKGLALRVL